MGVLRVVGIVLACAPAVCFAGSGDLQRFLGSANALRDTLEYERALVQVARAKALASTPEEASLVSLMEGVLQFELGKADEASAAFLEALSLDPAARLPWKVSPKVATAFEEARRHLTGAKAPAEVTRTAAPVGASPVRAIGIVGVAVGAAALVAGGACAVLARQRFDALDGATVAPSSAAGTRDSGKQLQLGAEVLLGAGAAILVTGAILWGVGARSTGVPKVSLAIGRGGGAVVLSGALP